MSERERQIQYDIIFIWNLKKYNKVLNITKRSRLTDTETSGDQSREGRGTTWGWRSGRHRLLDKREAQECIEQYGEHSQDFVIIVN